MQNRDDWSEVPYEGETFEARATGLSRDDRPYPDSHEAAGSDESQGDSLPRRRRNPERLQDSKKSEGSKKLQKRKQQHKPYVGDYGRPIEGGARKASVTFGMVALALAIGFVIGFLVFAALWLSSALTNLVWGGVTERTAPWFMPIVICTIGGLIIGLWTKYIGGDPEPLEKVLAQVDVTHGKAHLHNITPGTYYLRLTIDRNGNGRWDTGNYALHLQPEEVYYLPHKLKLRANWDMEQQWNIYETALDQQKPLEIKRNKPDSKNKWDKKSIQTSEDEEDDEFGSSGFGNNIYSGNKYNDSKYNK